LGGPKPDKFSLRLLAKAKAKTSLSLPPKRKGALQSEPGLTHSAGS